jgi:hypothetical protein
MDERSEADVRASLVTDVETAYLAVLDFDRPGEPWPPEVIELLDGAVEDSATLRQRFGEDAVAAAMGELEGLGVAYAELFAAALERARVSRAD